MQTLDAAIETATNANRLKHWTVLEYHRMSEIGLLKEDERTELIAGQIFFMAAKGTPHVMTLRLLAVALDAMLNDLVADRSTSPSFFVSTQDPIQLDDFSEPEPDLAIVRGQIIDYADRHPGPENIALVVEVADSTLKQDCEVKDKLYAKAGIEDYWVVDVKKQQINVFRNPSAIGYRSQAVIKKNQPISPLVFPERSIALTDIFVQV